MSSKTIITARLILASVFIIFGAAIVTGAAGNKSEEAMELSESSITAIPMAAHLTEADFSKFEYSDIMNEHEFIETDYSLVFEDTAPAEEPEEEVTEVEYTVQNGDALWDIACNFYGDGYMYSYIKDINGLTSDTIHEGQILTIKTTLTDDEKAKAYKESKEEIKAAEEAKKAAQATTSNSNSGSYVSSKNHKTSYEGRDLEYIGDFFITGYDPWCSHCCGKAKPNAVTASGAVAQVGVTVAMSSKYAFGTQIYIEGYGVYTVQDRGVGNGTVDIAAQSHEACYELTAYNVPVYIIH